MHLFIYIFYKILVQSIHKPSEQEFNLGGEDFPALPGFKKSGPQQSSQQQQQQQQQQSQMNQQQNQPQQISSQTLQSNQQQQLQQQLGDPSSQNLDDPNIHYQQVLIIWYIRYSNNFM